MIPIALGFFSFLFPRSGTGTTDLQEVAVDELFNSALDWQIRELSFWACVNMIANAMGRCEVRTYRAGEEVREREYYLWNVEPNTNQSSTAFWHKLIARLYSDNEALIVGTRRRDGYDALVVADNWEEPEEYPSRMNEYKGVTVGSMTYDKTFYENDVIHLKLNHVNMTPVIHGLYNSYYRLCQAAMKNYEWNAGQHWKVHVDQITQGKEGWNKAFAEMITAQVKPFLESNGAILPEFDGYKYENVGGGSSVKDTRDIRALIEDILAFTCRAFGIPYVLVGGTVEATGDATKRMLSGCLDPICDQLEEEITRKRYGFDEWQRGSYVRVDSSAIIHFDLFSQAAAIEKLVGSAGYSINDIRRAAGEAPINEPWADRHFLTKNIGDVVPAEDAQKGGSEDA